MWTLIPIYIITLGAFSRPNDVYLYPQHLVPHHVSIATLRFFVDSAGIIPALERSLWVLTFTLGIALAVGVPAGYALARFRFRGSGAFQLTVVGTRAFPIIILAVPLLVTFKDWGIADSILGVSLVHVALALPLVILTTAGIFAGIAVELEEAAMTLGCTRLSAVARIVLPARAAGARGLRDLRRAALLERGLRGVDADAAASHAAGTGALGARSGAAAVPPRRRVLPARPGTDDRLHHPAVPVGDVGSGGQVMAEVRFQSIRKTFGSVLAVDDVDLDGRRRRVRRAARAVGLRQDHAAPLPRRPRARRLAAGS